MAHIETVQIGNRVITHVRGRVFRSGEKRPNFSKRPKIKEQRRVCLLTTRGADQLEHWGVSQPCYGRGCKHTHHTRESIEEMVRRGEMRWLGDGRNVATWVSAKAWKPRKSGGMTVLQMVAEGA